MNKQLIVAAVGALLLPLSFVAKADGISGGTEFTVYGRVVAGVYRNDTDKDGESATWEIGGTGIDGGRLSGSRLGFSGDRDLGNGMNAGFKLEQEFDGNGANNSGLNRARHRYVYLNGGFGNFSVGNNVGPMGNTSYDGSYFLGGNFRKGTDRRDGLHYSNSVGGFNFGITLTGDEGDSGATPEVINGGLLPAAAAETAEAFLARVLAAARSDGIIVIPERTMGQNDEAYADTIRDAYNTAQTDDDKDIDDMTAAGTAENAAGRRARLIAATGLERNVGETHAQFDARLQTAVATQNSAAAAAERIADEDIDRTIIGAGYDFGAFAVNVGHDSDNTDTDRNITALLVSGDYGPLHYKLGYEQQDDARPDGENDLTAVGLFLAYKASENDTIYMEYESADDDHTPTTAGMDTDEGGTATVLGYSRTLGGGAIFVAEYRSVSNDASDGAPADADNSPSRLNLAMIVNF